MSSEHKEARRLVTCLVRKVRTCSEAMSPLQLCSAISGLRHMRSSEAAVRELLHCLVVKWEELQQLQEKQQRTSFSEQGLCRALYGLRSMRGDDKHVRKLLSLLGVEMAALGKKEGGAGQRGHGSRLVSGDVATALNGLRGMSSEMVEVRNIVSSLTEWLLWPESKMFSPRDICNSLSSLRNMTGESNELRRLLLVLSSKIKHSNEILVHNVQKCHNDKVSFDMAAAPPSLNHSSSARSSLKPVEVVLSLNGLQGMDSDHEEVRHLLTSLLPFLWSSPITFDTSDFVSMTNGLRSMKSEHVEVRSLLFFLCFVLGKSRGDLCIENKMMLQIMNNLNGMNSNQREVCHFLEALTKKLQESSSCSAHAAAAAAPQAAVVPPPPLRFAGSIAVLKNSPLLDKACPQVERLLDILLLL
jgi:hypothetical protein